MSHLNIFTPKAKYFLTEMPHKITIKIFTHFPIADWNQKFKCRAIHTANAFPATKYANYYFVTNVV